MPEARPGELGCVGAAVTATDTDTAIAYGIESAVSPGRDGRRPRHRAGEAGGTDVERGDSPCSPDRTDPRRHCAGPNPGTPRGRNCSPAPCPQETLRDPRTRTPILNDL